MSTDVVSVYDSIAPIIQHMQTSNQCSLDISGQGLMSLLFSDEAIPLPATVISLACCRNNLTHLEGLPDALETLLCSENPLIEFPESLPPNLRKLQCCRISTLTRLCPVFPMHLTELFLDNCTNLIEIPALPPGLVTLSCNNTAISSLPSLPHTLKKLYCSFISSLVELPTLCHTNLERLECKKLSIRFLPNLPDTLLFLDCSQNENLIVLPSVLPPDLRDLDCSSCPLLTIIPILPSLLRNLTCFGCSIRRFECASRFYRLRLPQLETFDCSLNELNTLPDLQICRELKRFNCSNNNLGKLSDPSKNMFLPPGLLSLNCSHNEITSIDSNELPFDLLYFNCKDNLLTEIPVLPDDLEEFNCSENPLEEGTLNGKLPDSLTKFKCRKIELQELPPLPPSLQSLDCSNNELTCLVNVDNGQSWPPCLEEIIAEGNHFPDSIRAMIPARITSVNIGIQNVTQLAPDI